MTERDQVVEILRKAISPPFKAVMGRGDGVVNVTGRPGYVWCRKLGKTEMLMEAYNRGAPDIEDVIVLVQESRIEGVKGYEVIGVASSTSPGNYYPEVPPHAWTHEWRPGIGRDRVTVYPRAWGYLRAEPIATGSMNVWVTPGWYYYDEYLRWYVGGYSPAFYPPPSGTWNQLLSFEPSDESLHITNGSIVGYGLRANIPTPSGCTYSIAAIESTGTFSTINENMIEDVRLFMDPIEDCGETGTFIIHSHQDDVGGGQLDHGLAHTPASLLDDDHTQYFLANCSRAFGGDPIPDGADTRSLGSPDAEWRNIYVGEAGRIYFRLDQSVDLYSSAAGVLKTNDNFHAARVFVGDGLVGSPAYSFQSDVDVGMYRIGANDLGFTTNSTLAFELNAVQQALITNGTNAAPGLAFISDPDTGLYRIGANRLGFATAGAFAVTIDASQKVGIGTTTIPHGGVGWAKLAIEGTNASADGPHIQITTSSDDYPLMQLQAYSHDSVSWLFDAYYDGVSDKSSDLGSNFIMFKRGDRMGFSFDSGVAPGAALAWNDMMALDATGGVHMPALKRGANQGAAGAAANELWIDSADESVKRGV